ncbi:F-box/FBD/LRR-repeat protein-like protein [Tanacetum coccineum]|uniref:F-box/FBD/LRR-repeat protein-like protein n=1 Tax=Tanacetum coccineum TaxID=301880 RepID=A0ABQ5J9N3_9ASTR
MEKRRIPETDRISNVLPSIIETILCLLPIQEAARTSILSRDWRYHWIKIPNLAFIEKMFQVSTDDAELSVLQQTFDRRERKVMTKRCKLFYAICQVLLVHEGPIHEFTLSTNADNSCIGEHDYNFEECEANFFTLKSYSHIWLEHLKELEVMKFGNRDNELDFVKLILAKSPVLKKVTIFLDEDEEVDKDEEVQILEILYRSQRASQVVKINVMRIETS